MEYRYEYIVTSRVMKYHELTCSKIVYRMILRMSGFIRVNIS